MLMNVGMANTYIEANITQIQTIILKVQRLNKLRKFELQNGLTIWCLVGTNDQDDLVEVFVLLGHFKS